MPGPGSVEPDDESYIVHAVEVTLAKHLGPRGITVNSVSVGFARTDMTAGVLADPANLERNISLTALGRIGQVPDIADAVAFLASDDARWITGTKIDVTGGVNL